MLSGTARDGRRTATALTVAADSLLCALTEPRVAEVPFRSTHALHATGRDCHRDFAGNPLLIRLHEEEFSCLAF